jgi:thiamine pyrophosphokinase
LETAQSLTAFIFANGAAADGPMVRQVLESVRDPWVIAADGGARNAQYYGLRVQTVIGDLDSLSAAEVQALRADGAEIFQFPVTKDETDLELTLLHAAEKGAARLRLFGTVGDRMDQTLSNVYLLALPALRGCDVQIVAANQAMSLLYPGQHLIHGAAGDTLSLIPMNGDAYGIRTAGLQYALVDEVLKFGPARGVSNVLLGTSAEVYFAGGLLLAVHTLGRA